MKRLISTIIALFLALVPGAGRRVIVIPVEFSDTSFKDKAAATDAMAALAGQYFSHQLSTSVVFDVAPTVKLKRELSWYGANSSTRKDEYIEAAVREACAMAGISLAPYDNNSDGEVDNVCIITAGGSEAAGDGADFIWPRHGYLRDKGGVINVGGVTVNSFSVSTEFSGLSFFCHEFAHSLGLQDMYDTDAGGSGGQARGLWGTLSLMDPRTDGEFADTPPNFTAIELELLGLGNPKPLRMGYQVLRPIGSGKEYMRIDTGNEDEYFLLECRNNEGWDAGIGGQGLIVYHIDRSSNNSWYSDLYARSLTARERWEFNQVNCRPDHQCARVIAALPGSVNVRTVFFPQPGHNAFSSDTDPAFRFWNGNASDLAIEDITLLSDGSVSFMLINPVAIESYQVFQDAAILSWHTDNTLDVQECELTWYPKDEKIGSKTHTERVRKQDGGSFYFIFENLEPSITYEVVISVLRNNGSRLSKTISFTTKTRQKVSYPFIYFNTMQRNADGSFVAGDAFPMRIYNARDVARVEWMFEGKYIYPEADGYWHLPGSGTLKAIISYNDGTTEIISKKLNVK